MNPVHFSTLKYMAQSPAHYRHYEQHPKEATTNARVGTATHALVLGGAQPLVYPERRTGREWQEFQTQNAGRLILYPREMEDAQRRAESVCNNKDAMDVLSGEIEKEFAWQYRERAVSSRPDAISDDHVADLKCTTCAAPNIFQWQVKKMYYHAQLNFYAFGRLAVGGIFPARNYLVAVEGAPVYMTAVYCLDDKSQAEGRKLWSSWFARLLECEATGKWPGYALGIADLQVPFLTTASDDDDDLVDW